MSNNTLVQVEVPVTEDYNANGRIGVQTANETSSMIESGSIETALVLLSWNDAGFTGQGWELTDTVSGFYLNINPDTQLDNIDTLFTAAFRDLADNKKADCIPNLIKKYTSSCVNW